jgi:hypothetical protein
MRFHLLKALNINIPVFHHLLNYRITSCRIPEGFDLNTQSTFLHLNTRHLLAHANHYSYFVSLHCFSESANRIQVILINKNNLTLESR